MDSNGRVAVVTGAGSGIGRSSALALLRDGYSVVLAGRRLELLQSTAEAEEKFRSRALPVQTDVGDPQAVRALFAKTYETFGRVWMCFSTTPGQAPHRCPLRT